MSVSFSWVKGQAVKIRQIMDREHGAGTLSNEEILRYGRQLILPEWGVEGQALLKSSSILVVGVGGLGCPATLYLAAAGVGQLGLLDYDVVERSNLHRQVLHSENASGSSKVESGLRAIRSINSMVKCRTHHVLLSKENAMEILSGYDIILDCTDNVATRYLLNDACVMLDKPLVSGSALRFEGQLTVYHHKGGPCYRCLFPDPPPPGTVTNCSEGGVIGPVPGVIGTMQALEALKIVSGTGTVLAGKMFLFDGLSGVSRTVTLRHRQPNCVVCGDTPSVSSLINYEQFCGSCAADKTCSVSLLSEEDRVSPQDYHTVMKSGVKHFLVDVRPTTEFSICHLQNAINIPLSTLQSEPAAALSNLAGMDNPVPIYVCCRQGNDSQKAVLILKEVLVDGTVRDLIGGLKSWTENIDKSFPKY